jgi:hypothetical protein
MESAPLGSCPNDPIQAKCGTPPARIIATSAAAGTNGSLSASTGFFPQASSGSSQTTTGPAASPTTYYYCDAGGRLNTVNNGNTAHGEGSSTCVPPVTKQYVYVDLDSYWTSTNSWHQEATGAACGGNACPVGGPFYANAYWNCNIKALRDWKSVTSDFAYAGNTMSAGSATAGPGTLDCVG